MQIDLMIFDARSAECTRLLEVMPRNPSGPMPGSPSRCYPSIVHVLDETVQNVGSGERMLGLKVGPARPSPFLVEFSLRVRVLEAHAAALFGAARS